VSTNSSISTSEPTLELDHRLLDIRVDAAKHAGKEIVAEHPGLGAHRLAVLVAAMQLDHRHSHR
jgi:hypothetical protein